MGMEVLPHQIEHLDDQGVSHGIEDLVACLAIYDDLFGPEYGEMLGDIGLFHAQPLDDGAGGKFSVAKLLEDGDASGMGKGLEDFGFKVSQRFRHTNTLAYSIFNILQWNPHAGERADYGSGPAALTWVRLPDSRKSLGCWIAYWASGGEVYECRLTNYMRFGW